MILIENVSKAFGKAAAVSDFSLAVDRGEIFGLVGPNGAGKTTTIRMVTGLLAPDRGRILVCGFDTVARPVEAKGVLGYVPDKGFLYDKLTAQEFLIFVASLHGLEKEVGITRCDQLLKLFSISDRRNELIGSFSQGIRQRLVFASALVHNPAALVIDEPFTGLDPFGVRMLRNLLASLSAQGTAIFLATHSLHIAEDVCSRIGFIRNGALVSVKDRAEIRGAQGGLEQLFMEISGDS